MSLRMIAATAAMLAAATGCSNGQQAPTNNQATGAAPALPDPVVMRFDSTMTGQPLRVPPAPLRLVVTRAEFEPTHLIACHRHPWSRYVYLEAGAVRVTNYDAHTVNDFIAGQVLVEAIDQWHDARVTSDVNAVLIVVDQLPLVPADATNSVSWPPPPPPPPAPTSPCQAQPSR